MGSEKLDKLKAQREALQARIRREEAKAKTVERKADTRRKILAGAAMLDRADRDAAFKAELMGQLGRFLIRADDRALFGLPILAGGTDAMASAKTGDLGDRSAA